MPQNSVIPIFPLPGLVLFPRTLLPLHLFEPRYVRLLRDALEGSRRMATAHMKRGWESDYYGKPPVHRIITIARILDVEELPEERYNIILEGAERAEIVEELDSGPYRKVKYRALTDEMHDEDRPALDEAREDLLELARRLAMRQPEMRKYLTNLENTHLHPGIIADQVASVLVREPYDRQSLLEATDVARRVKLLNVQLRSALSTISGNG